MREYEYQEQPHPHIPAVGPVPADFVRIDGALHPKIDRKLGYRGDQRYVLFYYVPEVEGVIWRDAFAHGFGPGAWRAYFDEIVPLTAACEAEMAELAGSSRDAIVLDRWRHEVYLAPRQAAVAFVGGRQT